MWLQFLAEVRMVTATVLALLGLQGLAAETVGWRSYFTENPTEFHDIPLTWEEEDTRVPDWISGTYVKNGPAQVDIMYFQMILPPPCFISDKFRQHSADHDQLAGRVRQAAQLQDVWCQHSVQVKIIVLIFLPHFVRFSSCFLAPRKPLI